MAPPTADADRGPCDACRHRRVGASIANATFAAMLPAMQALVQRNHVPALQDEVQLAGARMTDATENPRIRIDTYNGRPVASNHVYCGVVEFEGKYHIAEYKNRREGRTEFSCNDFSRKAASASHDCVSCAHLVRPSELALTELERCVMQLGNGEKLLDRIRTTLEARAPLEYESCVKGVGLLSAEPGFLPWCRAWSEDRSTEYGRRASSWGLWSTSETTVIVGRLGRETDLLRTRSCSASSRSSRIKPAALQPRPQ